MEVKSKTKKVLSIIFSLCFIMSCLSEAHAQTAPSSKTAAEQKSEILKKYPPNLSEMQEIGFGVKTVAPNGELVEKRVRPDCHFRGDDGKEYLIFYNNHIEQLRDIIHKKVENGIEEHSYALIGDKGLLQDFADGKDCWNDKLSWIPHNIKLAIASKRYIESFWEIFKMAMGSGKLKNAIKEYGGTLDNTDTPCMALVGRDLSEPIYIDKIDGLEKVEKEFYNIMASQNSYKGKVVQLNNLLDGYLNKVTPEASNMHAMAFCFPLNRASYYLSNLEKNLQDKDLETLSAMYALREKINRLTLEHRFIFEQNKAPILNIKIDRCKIIVEDKHRTMIFLDREETKKFITTIKDMLDSKASVLSNKYPIDEPFSKDELRKIAETLDIDSAQDLLDKAEKEVRDLTKDCNSQFANAGVSALRAVSDFSIQKTEDPNSPLVKFKGNAINEHEKNEFKFTKEEIEEYVDSQRQGNLNEAETKGNTRSNLNNDEDLSKNDFNKDEKILKSKDNRSLLEKAIGKLNLNTFAMSSLMDAFEKYLDYCVKLGELHSKEDKRNFIKKLKENEEDYVNLLKLYIRLHRGKYEERDNFYGTLVTEDRQHETENGRWRVTREYFIREIKEFSEGLKDLFWGKSQKTEDEL